MCNTYTRAMYTRISISTYTFVSARLYYSFCSFDIFYASTIRLRYVKVGYGERERFSLIAAMNVYVRIYTMDKNRRCVK